MRPVLKDLRTLMAQLGRRRLLLIGGVALALLIGLGTLAIGKAAPAMGYLYTDLDPSAAATITEKLKGQNVPFTLSSDGKAIMAPVDRLADLRMDFAGERLGGKIGYDVLDQEEPFGVSSSRAKINETRAIEGELSRSIESLDHVEHARVHIVMPEREIFATKARAASAAVTLKTSGRLSPEAVEAVRHLIAASVPDLLPTSISVVDQTGALLARAGEAGSSGASDLDSRQTAVEARMREQIETMLEPIVGAGHVRAEVSALLERNHVTEEADVFDPDTQVIGHQVTVDTNAQNDATSPGAEGATVSTQLPDAAGRIAGGSGETQRSANHETSEDTTFQNSHKRIVSEYRPGKIERLSVAVMVDGAATAMTKPELARITRLVQNAVGYDADRGDAVAVEVMRFAAAERAAAEESSLPLGLTPGDLLGLAKWAIGAVGLAFAAWLVRGWWRPVSDAGDVDAGLPDATPLALPPGEDSEQVRLEDQTVPNDLALLDQDIALAQVDGSIRLSALKRIGDTIAASPGESVTVIRQWMNA